MVVVVIPNSGLNYFVLYEMNFLELTRVMPTHRSGFPQALNMVLMTLLGV